MKIGILAIGSHDERHGAALPKDTDARIAEFIAKEVAKRTNTEFLKVLKTSYEFPEIDTGSHESLEKVKKELVEEIRNAKEKSFDGIVLINAHGGNTVLEKHIAEIEKKTETKLKMDSRICKIEGPHAGSGELSIGTIIGITDVSKLEEHRDLDKYPEIGFTGFEKAQEKYEWAEKHAKKIAKEEIKIDKPLGKKLLESAIEAGFEKVRELRPRR